MATVKKTIKKTIKKAQRGVTSKPITENTFRFGKNMGTDSPTMSAFDSMRKSAGLDRSNRIDTSARAKAIKSGEYREDKKSGDLFRVNKSKSGTSFPDLSGDKKVTKKDILIAKGVLSKPAKAAKKGASVKAKSGVSMKKCKYGCK